MVDIYNHFKDFKSFEVLFHNNNAELQKLICTVKSIEKSSLFLNSNNQKNKNILAPAGTDLKLHIYTEQGIYSATSKILLVTKGLLNTEYIISYPTNSKHCQRREFFRADIHTEFKMEVTTTDKTTPLIIIKDKTKNICGKGMNFISDKPFVEYDTIQVELHIEDTTINTFAELVYSQTILIKGVKNYIHAFTFTDISKRDIEFLIKKCFLHQLDLRKKPF